MSQLSLSTAKSCLDAYLDALEQRASEAVVELGLDRVQVVFDRLFSPDAWATTQIVTIAGTNGKGSTVAFAEAMARSAGRSVAAYTSPHIIRFNERLRLNGEVCLDSDWLAAFEAVDAARAEVALTYFEHVTLAALVVIERAGPDLALLEVGLGGRLDAVNVIDPDVAVLTSIGLDHMNYLGPTRADIGREKLGIARADRPLIIAERDWPVALETGLSQHPAHVVRVGEAFDWAPVASMGVDPRVWSLTVQTERGPTRLVLPPPSLVGAHQMANAAAAIVALAQLWGEAFLTSPAVAEGIETAQLPGRFETLAHAPDVIVDVAHNEASAQALAEALAAQPHTGRTFAVFSAFADKAIEAMAAALADQVDHWWVAGMDGPRGSSAAALMGRVQSGGVTAGLDAVKSIPDALDRALAQATPVDRVVVFGSFQVLAQVSSRWSSKE